MRSKKYIEVVRTTVYGLSSLSQESCEAIFAVLAKHYSNVGITIINSLSDLESLVERQPDLVFLGMEFLTDPKRIWLSEFLDDHEIAYTGSSKRAHELGRDKSLAKQCVLNAGLNTPASYVVKQNERWAMADVRLNFPMFVKPTNRGGGVGIDENSVVHNFDQLSSKINSIASRFHADTLMEEYLPGREFSVAIMQDEHSAELLVLPIELIAPLDTNGNRLLSNKIKSANDEQALQVTDPAVKSKVTALALAVFLALGARDYGRIDIRLDKNGTPHFLEVNLIPSLISGYGSFPKACMINLGLEHEPMTMMIARLGLARKMNDPADVPEPITMADPVLSSSEIVLQAA